MKVFIDLKRQKKYKKFIRLKSVGTEAFHSLTSLATELGCVTKTLTALTNQMRKTAMALVDQKTSDAVMGSA